MLAEGGRERTPSLDLRARRRRRIKMVSYHMTDCVVKAQRRAQAVFDLSLPRYSWLRHQNY